MSVVDNEQLETLECNNAVAQMIAEEMQSGMDKNETNEKGLKSQQGVANSDTERTDGDCTGNPEVNHQNDTEYKNEKDVKSDDKFEHDQLNHAAHTDICDNGATLHESCEVVPTDNQQTSCECEDEMSSEFCDIEELEIKTINCSKDYFSKTELPITEFEKSDVVESGNCDVFDTGNSEMMMAYPQVTGIQPDWVCEGCSLPFSEYLKQVNQYNRMMAVSYNPLPNPFANPANFQIMEYYNTFPVIPNFVYPPGVNGNTADKQFPRNHPQTNHHFYENLDGNTCSEESRNGICSEQPGNDGHTSESNASEGANVEETENGKTSVENYNIDTKGDQDDRANEKREENTGVNQEQTNKDLGENESVVTDEESGSDDEVHLPDKRSTCTSASQSSITDDDENDGRNLIEECVSETCLQNVDDEKSEELCEENPEGIPDSTSEITSDSNVGSPDKTVDSERERRASEIRDMFKDDDAVTYDSETDELVIDLERVLENRTYSERANNVDFRNTSQYNYQNVPIPVTPFRYQYIPPGGFPGIMDFASHNASSPMSYQQGFGIYYQSNPQMFYPGGCQQPQQFQTPPPSFHFQNSNPPQNDGTNNPGITEQSLLQGQAASSPFQYPAVYFSNAGLMTVLLKYDVAIEMTLDNIIRVVSHQNKVVAATNTRGTCSCIYHPMVKIVQDSTTIDADLFQEWKAQMATEEMTFCNKNKGFKFSYSAIQECNVNFKDLSRDDSVNFLFGQKKFQSDVIPTCIQRINNAQYSSMKNGGFSMWLNGVKIIQNERGDVCVTCGPKYLRICPTTTNVKIRTHFAQMSVEANGTCDIIRGVHWLHARQNGEIYLTNSKIEAGFDRNKKVWACVMPHRLPLRIEFMKKSHGNGSTKKKDVENH